MREIKFRAWDMSDELMYYNVQFGINFDDGSHYPFERFLGNQDDKDYHEWELMQYTGLTDKNGKEIYEGDIVKVVYNDNSTKSGMSDVFEIGFDGGCFGVVHTNLYSSYARDGRGSDFVLYFTVICKIIGNIYENPELHKGEECEK